MQFWPKINLSTSCGGRKSCCSLIRLQYRRIFLSSAYPQTPLLRSVRREFSSSTLMKLERPDILLQTEPTKRLFFRAQIELTWNYWAADNNLGSPRWASTRQPLTKVIFSVKFWSYYKFDIPKWSGCTRAVQKCKKNGPFFNVECLKVHTWLIWAMSPNLLLSRHCLLV